MSRVIRKMKDEKIIQTNGSNVVIINMQGLEDLAKGAYRL
ncbi:MAG: hypothetical protein ABR533_11185 [Desulfonatronovibrio sp.]